MLKKVLVANRGEIAVRVIRTCREMGIASVALYSDVDRNAMHVRMADEAYAIGGSTPAESYLNVDAILDVLKRTETDCVHPGYGFLAENAGFARAVVGTGAVFVGPPPEAIETMGDKISSRIAAESAGVAGVPGTTEAITDPSEVVSFGEATGWPIAIKAAFGGGGRGMKVVASAADVVAALESARREAAAYFGRDEVYMEKYLSWPRHIEMQVMADNHGNAVWLGERDCSTQRRHQKLIEESPAPGFSEDLRQAMGEAAVKVTLACGYANAGTVEFLYQDGEFYFLEMNTRLQVEHPVTEMLTGLDLVRLQMLVASGESLPVSQQDIVRRGHAIEARINAEDPAEGRFVPSPGRITVLNAPGGPWARLDAGYEAGDELSQYYDNLIAKLIVWAPHRDEAIARLRRALAETRIAGVATTIPAELAILSHGDFQEGIHSTRWLEERVDLSAAALAAASEGAAGRSGAALAAPVDPAERPGERPGGDRGELLDTTVTAELDGRRYQVRLWLPLPGNSRSSRLPARVVRRRSPSSTVGAHSGGGNVLIPMQGTIVKVLVAAGDTVEAGQAVCVLEAMKMENSLEAGRGGTVKTVNVSEGDSVSAGDVAVVIE